MPDGNSDYGTGASNSIDETVTQASTTTAVATDVSSPAIGQLVTLTATVSVVGPGGGQPNGTVKPSIRPPAGNLGTASLVWNSQQGGFTASVQTSFSSLGGHSITAAFHGDDNFQGSTSAAVDETVLTATTTDVTADLSSAVYGQAVTPTATVAVAGPTGAQPTGTVNFVDQSTDKTSGRRASRGTPGRRGLSRPCHHAFCPPAKTTFRPHVAATPTSPPARLKPSRSSSQRQPVEWDPSGNPANLGGAGVWSVGVAVWYDQATGMLVSWNDNYAAVFTGAGHIATISGTVSTSSIEIDTNGYTIASSPSGGNFAIFPGGTSIMVANGVVATIAPITGSGELTVCGRVVNGSDTSGGTLVLASEKHPVHRHDRHRRRHGPTWRGQCPASHHHHSGGRPEFRPRRVRPERLRPDDCRPVHRHGRPRERHLRRPGDQQQFHAGHAHDRQRKDCNFAGTFTGNLALAKYSVGTLTTDGDSTNSGPVDVYDGTLDVTGSFTVVPQAIPGQGNPQVTGLPTTDAWVVTASDLYKGNASWTCSASLQLSNGGVTTAATWQQAVLQVLSGTVYDPNNTWHPPFALPGDGCTIVTPSTPGEPT